MLEFFQWDLKFVLPIHFGKCFLANGILFQSEFYEDAESQKAEEPDKKIVDVADLLATEALSTADVIASRGSVHLRKEDASTIAAGIIYYARKNVFTSGKHGQIPKVQSIWPQELVLLTRCSEATA